jgi:hypothetical protein
MELPELLKIAAEPHLIASATKANEYLARLQAFITDLRLEVSELELKCDLELNTLLQGDIAIERGKALWKISPTYQEWKKKAGTLTDLRAIRRNLERHTDLLISQEKFRPQGNSHFSI